MICPRCGKGLCWQCDYDFSDFGYEEEGVVSCWHCSNCGVDIEIYMPSKQESGADEGSVP